nr:M24 family metallopeptidase [Hymenobacter cellulosilyticus]
MLHYETNDKPRLGNDLILMDCGAEYHGYSADVTRTAPPSGKFSPAQRQIYELVLAAQDAAFKECKPGSEFQGPHKAAQQVINDGLIKLGIIKDAAEARKYFPTAPVTTWASTCTTGALTSPCGRAWSLP